jgi:hypothetical protein
MGQHRTRCWPLLVALALVASGYGNWCMAQAAKHPAHTPPAKPADPCGTRPAIPTNPLWHMGLARGGNLSSFTLLQTSIDWLTCQGKRGKPFDADSKEFLHDLFEAFSSGGSVIGQPEAARLADHYVNGGGTKVTLNPYVYQSSAIVTDASAAMKKFIAAKHDRKAKVFLLRSTDRAFYQSAFATPLPANGRSQQTQGTLLKDGGLLTEQNNQRLKNADNRFALASQTQILPDEKYATKWSVSSRYDFEPFSVGHITNIPLGSGKILKVPDGLSEYLAHANIAVATVFDYEATWFENWSE